MIKHYLYLCFLATIILFTSQIFLAGDFYIIANNDIEADSLTKQELQDIFLGDIGNWDNGDRIVLAVLRSGDAQRAFLNQIIERTPAQYNTYWKQIVFTGRGTPPQEFNNDNDLIGYVSNNRGAIGFVSEQPEDDSVKIIEIK